MRHVRQAGTRDEKLSTNLSLKKHKKKTWKWNPGLPVGYVATITTCTKIDKTAVMLAVVATSVESMLAY